MKEVKKQTVFNARQSLTFTADEMHNVGAALTCDTPGGLTVTANSVSNSNVDEHRKERGISVAVSRNPNESERTDDPKIPVGSAITSVSQIGYLRKEEHSAVLPTAVNADTATLNLPGMEAVNTNAEQTRKQISSSKTHVKIVLPTVNLAQAKETVSKVPSLFSREGNTPTISERPRDKGKEEEVEEESVTSTTSSSSSSSSTSSSSSSSTSSSSVHDIRRYAERNSRNKGKEEEVEAVEIKDSSVAVFAEEFGNQASGLANRMADGLAGMVIEGGLALRDACIITKDAINGECTAEMKSKTFADGVERETVLGVLDQDIAIDTLRGALAAVTGGASIAGESMYHAGVAIGKGDAEGTQDALAGAALGLVVTRGVLKAKGAPNSSSSKSVTNRSTVQKSSQPKVQKPKAGTSSSVAKPKAPAKSKAVGQKSSRSKKMAVERSGKTAKEIVQERPFITKEYLREIERVSNLVVDSRQRSLLKQCLQKGEFKKLSVADVKCHRTQFDRVKNKLIKEWENNTGKKWPIYDQEIVDALGLNGKFVGNRYDAHHIIQNNHGGANEWWNIHPVQRKGHIEIHRKNGVCSSIFNQSKP